MEIFKIGRRTFIAIPKIKGTKEEATEAIRTANKFFKVKLKNLIAESGEIDGEYLHIFYPNQRKKGTVWVVSKRRENR